MSYFTQGWDARRAQQPRWQEGGEDEDEGYGVMECGARWRGGRMQMQGGSYQPPLAGGQGGDGGFTGRQQRRQERGRAWNQRQDTRRVGVWPRGHEMQTGHREGRQSVGRGGGRQRAAYGSSEWYADPGQRNKMMKQVRWRTIRSGRLRGQASAETALGEARGETRRGKRTDGIADAQQRRRVR